MALVVVSAVVLTGCQFGIDGDDSVATMRGPGIQADGAERYRKIAMTETAQLAKRICHAIRPRVLAHALGGTDFPRTSTKSNDIALGYARDVDIAPIPLQRAAYNGCDGGVRRQR